MLPTPKCSPPCSPELGIHQRSMSVVSVMDLDDLGATDMQLAHWGEVLSAGARSSCAEPCADEGQELWQARAAGLWREPSVEEPEACGGGVLSVAPPRMPPVLVSPSGVLELAEEAEAGWHGLADGEPARGRIHGAVVLWVAPAGGLGGLRKALRVALLEVLAPAAGAMLSVDVWPGRRVQRADAAALAGSQAHVEFPFEVALLDPNDRPSALEVLKLEATFAGARRLLPAMANSLALAGPKAVRLHLKLGPQQAAWGPRGLLGRLFG